MREPRCNLKWVCSSDSFILIYFHFGIQNLTKNPTLKQQVFITKKSSNK